MEDVSQLSVSYHILFPADTKKKGVKIITSPIDFWWNKIKKKKDKTLWLIELLIDILISWVAIFYVVLAYELSFIICLKVFPRARDNSMEETIQSCDGKYFFISRAF